MSGPEDEWRKVVGFPDYSVSSAGDVRHDKAGNVLRKFAMKSRKPYSYVNVYAGGKMFTRRVGVLVCEAFHGPRPSGDHEAAHNNGQHADDRANNLRWATRIENAADRKLHGTQIQGARVNLAKLDEAAVRVIRNSPRFYGSNIELAKRFNVGVSAILCVLARKTWRHVK